MKHYREYMDRQSISEAGLAHLMELPTEKRHRPAHWPAVAALAACCCLIAGLGAWKLLPAGEPYRNNNAPAPSEAPLPQASSPALSGDLVPEGGNGDTAAFVAAGPGEEVKVMFPMVYAVPFRDATDEPEIAASIALPDGSFFVSLDRESIQKLFWGPDGKPEVTDPKADPGDFPLMLADWAGYTVSGQCIYDGSGRLWELDLWGEKGRESFSLRAALGHMPPTCVVNPDRQTTEIEGVPVSAWYQAYDRNRDGAVEYVCSSEFMAGDVGIRFQNVGAKELDKSTQFSSIFVTQMLHADGGLHLEHILTNDQIPAWREEHYESLEQALAEPDFAPYLPQRAPEGFEVFSGGLSYQEDEHYNLWVEWNGGYGYVSVNINYPGRWVSDLSPVDVSIPESYDWRLYNGPIWDSVPEEYRDTFFMPTFRAEDMSLEIIQARESVMDTGGSAYRFQVLHENGVTVSYDCTGVTSQEAWVMVESTLNRPD